MMKHAYLNLLLICSVLLVLPRTGFAQDTDSDNGTVISNGDWVEEDMDPRGRNALHLEPLYDDDEVLFLTFSKQDCLDNIGIDINFTITEDGVEERGDLYLMEGEDCDNTADFRACDVIVSESSANGFVNFLDLKLNQIFEGVDCNSTQTVTRDLYVAVVDSTSIFDEENDRIRFFGQARIDFQGPAVGTDIKHVLVGDDNVEVKFTTQESAVVKGYAAFYKKVANDDCSDGPLVAGALPTSNQVDGAEYSASDDENTIKISGLENGAFYQVAVATLDDAGNPSVLSSPKCAVPQESIGIGDATETDGEYCFIATAAFDSYDHPTVRVLRVFRDSFLRKMPGGNAIVSAYYAVGPGLAGWIQGDAVAKGMVRSSLGLFAELTKVLVNIGPLWILVGLLGAMLLGLVLGLAAPVRRRSR